MIDVTRAYGLDFMFPALDSFIGARLRDAGEFARPEMEILARLLRANPGTYVDVGANIGSIALPVAAFNRSSKVVAIEANRHLAGLLAANALNNQLANVEVHHAAVGASAGLVEFPTPALDRSMNFGSLGIGARSEDMETFEQVRMCRLDDLAPADTHLVKLDVEGFEPQVIEGAGALIDSRRASWVIEHKGDAKAHAVTGRFLDAGYAVYWLFAPFVTRKPHKPHSPSSNVTGDINILAMPAGEPPMPMTRLTAADQAKPSGLEGFPYLKSYGF